MKTVRAQVGEVTIGQGCPVVIQSMCNTDTNDIEGSVAQCTALYEAGASIVRLTTQGIREVESLARIKEQLSLRNVSVPLVADIHFSSDTAIAAASVADKVRINPGNFHKDFDKASSQFIRFLSECKKYGTAVRIGINHGSLGSRIIEKYGNTPNGMVEAIWEWVEMCRSEHFENVVLSLKASNVPVMVAAYRLLDKKMESEGIRYPLHLGVTEAGNGDMGRIKSATGLATLLGEGIGDTIRVSLTENPVNEIPVARAIADYFSSRQKNGISSSDAAFHIDASSYSDLLVKASCSIGPLLLDRKIDNFTLSASIGGKICDSSIIDELKTDIMQATRRRIDRCEYVACPSCGRTQYDIEKVFNEIKSRTSHLKGVTIAVMGCIVNGPGEMADADYGYVGEGKGKVTLYKGHSPVIRGIPQEEAIDRLIKLIESEKDFRTRKE